MATCPQRLKLQKLFLDFCSPFLASFTITVASPRHPWVSVRWAVPRVSLLLHGVGVWWGRSPLEQCFSNLSLHTNSQGTLVRRRDKYSRYVASLLAGGAHAAGADYPRNHKALGTPPKALGPLSLRRPVSWPCPPDPIPHLPMVVMVDTEKKKEPMISQRPMLVVLPRTMSPFWYASMMPWGRGCSDHQALRNHGLLHPNSHT